MQQIPIKPVSPFLQALPLWIPALDTDERHGQMNVAVDACLKFHTTGYAPLGGLRKPGSAAFRLEYLLWLSDRTLTFFAPRRARSS